MRIRKRTPARAADPGPAPALAASPPRPPPPLLHQLPEEEGSREQQEEEEAEEEKRVILVAGVRVQEGDGDRVPAAASNDRCVWTEKPPSPLFSSAMDDDVPKPEPQDAGARCSRNDGKRWRCKGAAVPGYLLCDRHIAWSTRKRKRRPNKHKQQQHGRGGGGVLLPSAAKDEAAASAEEDAPRLAGRGGGGGDDDGGFFGGFRKRARGGGPEPAA
ncbi:growth-regulating factor 4-like isoform X1 [Panicum virgatum]|uniref:Growth-regulating factor n=1 Tax=Panicum virgatum TaxID=38727 RepID=A0A8T0NKF3_PANVG|nr:growth-regulating factor 4-like isoform X1 [Panicum virgatum]KAG2548769.1 hypothetical protein PVAP13_9KG217100 [Panicum virgatum]